MKKSQRHRRLINRILWSVIWRTYRENDHAAIRRRRLFAYLHNENPITFPSDF